MPGVIPGAQIPRSGAWSKMPSAFLEDAKFIPWRGAQRASVFLVK